MPTYKLKFNIPFAHLSVASPLARVIFEEPDRTGKNSRTGSLDAEALETLQAIARRFDDVEENFQLHLLRLQREMTSKAIEIASVLVQGEEDLIRARVEEYVRLAIQHLTPSVPRSVSVHPDCVEMIQGWLERSGQAAMDVVPDPLIAPGDCHVEAVDAGIAATLDAFLDALSQRELAGKQKIECP